MLISPWTCFQTDTPSWKENIDKDIITREFHKALVGDFLSVDHARKTDPFGQPFEAEPGWWKDAEVGSILNLAGTNEVFRDHICQLGQTMAQAGLNIETIQCPEQIHIECILDSLSQLEPGPMSEAVWQWLEDVL